MSWQAGSSSGPTGYFMMRTPHVLRSVWRCTWGPFSGGMSTADRLLGCGRTIILTQETTPLPNVQSSPRLVVLSPTPNHPLVSLLLSPPEQAGICSSAFTEGYIVPLWWWLHVPRCFDAVLLARDWLLSSCQWGSREGSRAGSWVPASAARRVAQWGEGGEEIPHRSWQALCLPVNSDGGQQEMWACERAGRHPLHIYPSIYLSIFVSEI